MLKKLSSLLSADLRLVSRDPMLYVMFAAPFLTVLVLRFAVPVATELLLEHLQFDLGEHISFVAAFLAFIQAMLAGMVFGFIVLDERDEGVVAAIAVTPISRSGYIAYRLAVAGAFGLLFFLVVILSSRMMSVHLIRICLASLLAAVNSSFYLLFLSSAAGNKVEGLAVAKLGGLVFMAPVAGYLLPGLWQIPLAFVPTYWIVPVLYYPIQDFLWIVPSMLLVHSAWFAIMYRWFQRKVLI